MKKRIALSALLFLVALAPHASHAQSLRLVGGRSLPHITSAWTMPRGQFALHGFGSSYYQTVVVTKPGMTPEGRTFWDVQGALALYYASGKHLEWALTQVVYQDTHRDKGYNVPDDLFLNLKFGSYGSKLSPLKAGFSAHARFPLARHHNILFEPYSSGSISLGLMGMASYSPDLLLPENAFNFHVNLGFLHHNDIGKRLTGAATDTIAVLSPSQEFLWGMGFAVPTSQFDFTFELYGQSFIVKPPVTAYSRESFIYFSPGVSYRPKYWAAFNVGFDFRLSGNTDETVYTSGLTAFNKGLPSHPNWRVNFGFRLHLNQTAPPDNRPLFVSSNGRLVARQKSLENQLNQEQRKTETAEDELEKIRRERKRMESMLARLRSLLYDSKTSDQSTTPETPDAPAPEPPKTEPEPGP